MPNFRLEDEVGGIVAGIDEAGRGPWAGPVVAAALVFDRVVLPEDLAEAIDDSKDLTAERRQAVYARLPGCSHFGVGAASAREIDRINILNATFLAMTRAWTALLRHGAHPTSVLIDGNRAPNLACPCHAIVGGDRRSLSIAAASIVAKVTRDRIMARLDRRYPNYGWARNAGYGTRQHQSALYQVGITRHHRISFKPIYNLLSKNTL